jgi:hypothetical protein
MVMDYQVVIIIYNQISRIVCKKHMLYILVLVNKERVNYGYNYQHGVIQL